jgi:hypothetical protein
MSSKTTHKRSRARALVAESRATFLRSQMERIETVVGSKGKMGEKLHIIEGIATEAVKIDDDRLGPEFAAAAVRSARDLAESNEA